MEGGVNVGGSKGGGTTSEVTEVDGGTARLWRRSMGSNSLFCLVDTRIGEGKKRGRRGRH